MKFTGHVGKGKKIMAVEFSDIYLWKLSVPIKQ